MSFVQETKAMAHPARLENPTDTVNREPVRAERRAAVRPRRISAPTFSVRQRLMLIEDDFMLRAHLSELLAAEGYLVTCAADGAEALARLEREPPPAVILVDIMMPRMDGLSFRQAQLQSPALRDIPAIAMTAARGTVKLESVQFTDVMRKPIDVDRLVESLAKLCPTS
jgi:CheY-like chemotaxis protein